MVGTVRHFARSPRFPQRVAPTIAALSLIVLNAAGLIYGGNVDALTLNEPSHLVAGLYQLRFGDFALYPVNPPLTRLVAAMPAYLVGFADDIEHRRAHSAGERIEGEVARNEIEKNPRKFWRMCLCGRISCICFSMIGAWVCFKWGTELYGVFSGVIACALWCFSPEVLGHGHLISADIPAAATGLLATYSFSKHFNQASSARDVFITGILLGIALLTKFTLLVLVPMWTIIWFSTKWYAANAMRERLVSSLHFLILIGAALWTVNVGYGFEQPFARLRDLNLVSGGHRGVTVESSRLLSGIDEMLRSVPLPIPANYVIGIDIQKRDLENTDKLWPTFVRGQWTTKCPWWYYIYGLLVKTPLGLLAMVALAGILAVVSWATHTAPSAGHIRVSEVLMLLVPAVLIIVVSLGSGFGEHVRYVFPALPYIHIWASRSASMAVPRPHVMRPLCMLFACASVCSVATSFPHTLSYFNELVGGPAAGHKCLLHSNVDWGQDLYYLKAGLQTHDAPHELYLAYSGPVDPSVFGIVYRRLPRADERMELSQLATQPTSHDSHVLCAVSCNLLYSMDNRFAYLRDLSPKWTAGYSIYVYDFDPKGP